MDTFASNVIATMGGSVRVARMIKAPVSTVESWKRIGLSGSRLDHLRRASEQESIAVDWETGLPLTAGDGDTTDHATTNAASEGAASAGNDSANSRPVVSHA